ncbi:FGGY-family carbohydrate kinase, partial [Gallibacterium anatis]
AEFFALAERAESSKQVLFLPYLSGERTPHNDPYASGVFWGLHHDTTQAEMARAVVEGVSFALTEGIEVLHESGIKADNIMLIGGGAKSHFWRQLLADISGMTFEYRVGGDVGPALGAAKLAQMALHPEQDVATFCPPLELEARYLPDRQKFQQYRSKYEKFKQLYQRLKYL